MKLTFLGTGTSQGIPLIQCPCEVCHSKDPRDKRLRTSVHLEDGDLSLVIDIGPDFRLQMLQNQIKKIDAILITHAHADHTAGLDDIRPFNFIQKSTVPFYAEKLVIEDLIKRFEYIFKENTYPGVPQITLHEITSGTNFQIGNLSIFPFRVWHGNLGILGFKFNNLVYITDAKRIDDEVLEQIKNCDTLIINALRFAEHKMHFNFQQALAIIEKINAKKTYLIHISHQLGLSGDILKILPPAVFLAYDGLQVNITS
ncbi:MAG: MBL fold metallo-hydrolase [Bacteroidota bacterium]|nr:MBL fold metallo-hydrolase [Bacteroidota bacterium]